MRFIHRIGQTADHDTSTYVMTATLPLIEVYLLLAFTTWAIFLSILLNSAAWPQSSLI